MKIKHMLIAGLLLVCILLLAIPGIERSQAATRTNIYSMNWNVISGGGTSFSSNGKYTLGNTIGQGVAGQFTNYPFLMNVGFWLQGVYHGFLPLLIR
jgi:hypothetical protein